MPLLPYHAMHACNALFISFLICLETMLLLCSGWLPFLQLAQRTFTVCIDRHFCFCFCYDPRKCACVQSEWMLTHKNFSQPSENESPRLSQFIVSLFCHRLSMRCVPITISFEIFPNKISKKLVGSCEWICKICPYKQMSLKMSLLIGKGKTRH